MILFSLCIFPNSCAGLMAPLEGKGGACSIRLSEPLLKLRPRKDLVQTLLVSEKLFFIFPFIHSVLFQFKKFSRNPQIVACFLIDILP